jgi:hypothetical protein
MNPSAVDWFAALAFTPTAVADAVAAVAPLAFPVTKFVPKNWPCAVGPASHHRMAAKASGTAVRTPRLIHPSPPKLAISDILIPS